MGLFSMSPSRGLELFLHVPRLQTRQSMQTKCILIANIVTTSKALVTSSDALVSSSFLFLIANIVATSKAPVTTSVALVTSSFLFLIHI